MVSSARFAHHHGYVVVISKRIKSAYSTHYGLLLENALNPPYCIGYSLVSEKRIALLAETEAIGQALKNGDVVLNPIPHTLYLRFNRLGIDVDDDIKNAIASFGLQQTLDAISHVDSFSHTIKNKKAAFLLRIEQPPVDIVTKLRSQMKFVERQMQTPQYQAISQDSFPKIRLKLKK